MRQIELIRAGFVALTIAFLILLLTSCSIQRETSKRIYDIKLQSPIKVNTLNKCDRWQR